MSFKVGVFIGCLLVFVLHFSMILLHNIPEKYISTRMESYSHLWCYPIFHQGWALFAPEPQSMTKHMDVRLAIDSVWSDWHRVEDICLDEHRAFRVTHFSKLCHVTQNATYHLWLALDKFDTQGLPAAKFYPSANGYGIATHYAESFGYHYLAISEPDSLEVRLVLEDPFEGNESPEEVYYFPVKHCNDK